MAKNLNNSRGSGARFCGSGGSRFPDNAKYYCKHDGCVNRLVGHNRINGVCEYHTTSAISFSEMILKRIGNA